MEPNNSSETDNRSASQEIPVFYGTSNSIVVFTETLVLNHMNVVSTPRSVSFKLILVFSFYLHIGLPVVSSYLCVGIQVSS
jgi:hypothetical protein